MSIFSKLGALIFAPTDAAGNPRQVNNHDAQVWSTEVERIIQVALEGGDLLVYGSLSALNADLDHPAHTGAILIGESIADDGLYMKQGASGSGSWVKIGNVPGQGFVKATNAGAGTANAIAATTPVAVNETQLILLPITAANTASPVTVAFNGGAALTVKTVSGNDVAAGGLPAGSVMLGVVQGGDFRLLSDQASAGIQAAAEAAQVAAEAALAEMREKSVGAFPDNASADAFLTAEGLTKQEGTIYFNTTADVWRYWDGSAWQTFPYAIVADGGVTEEKLADGAVGVAKMNTALSNVLASSFVSQRTHRPYQNDDPLPFGIKLSPKPATVHDGWICQDFTYVPLTGHFYSAWDTALGERVVTRHKNDGSFDIVSEPLDTIIGHGQGFGHFFDANNDLTLVAERFDRKGVVFFNPMTVDGGTISNVRSYELNPNTLCWPAVSFDQKTLIAGLDMGGSSIVVRGYDIATMLVAGGGDFRNDFLFEINLSPLADYVSANVVQGFAMEGPNVYVVTGASGYGTAKYLSCFNITTGEREWRIRVQPGKQFANARGGVSYEVEGLEWVTNAAGAPYLWTSVVVRREGGTGYDNIAMPFDVRGFGGAGLARYPNGVGILSREGNDIVVPVGNAWQVRRYNGPDLSTYDVLFSIDDSGNVISPGRMRVGTYGNIDPASGTDQGINFKGDLGRMVASAATVSAQYQTAGAGVTHMNQFFSGTTMVGNIATDGTGLSLNSASDALWKEDEGELTFEQARAVLDLILFRRFRWNEHSGNPGELDEGVFAQELYKIYPKAVTVGYWMDEKTAEPVEEGDEGAIYVPWSVNYAKLVTVIGRCVQGVMARLDAIEQRIAN